MMESLNVAYDVEENRPFWKTRPLAIGLTFLIGFLLIVALALMLVGPNFGGWLAAKVGLSTIFAAIWPYLRWAIAIVFTSSEEQHQSGPTRHRFQFISSCGVDRSTLRRWT